MLTFGFIGTGNMGGALARAARKRLDGGQLLLANRTAAKAEALAAELGAQTVDNQTAAAQATYLFLGVKPQMMAEMLSDIAPVLAARKDRFFLVPMAAGLTIADIQRQAGGAYPVIRIMPNTPSSIGEGMILAVRTVRDMDEAVAFINRHGTGHSEAIITRNYFKAQHFLDYVDAAAVYVNASTRFTDGGEFGLGAEIGISTQKMHARGPMGLEELTSCKYVIYGEGQVR